MESSGTDSFHLCLSDGDMLIFLSELFILNRMQLQAGTASTEMWAEKTAKRTEILHFLSFLKYKTASTPEKTFYIMYFFSQLAGKCALKVAKRVRGRDGDASI